MNTSGLRPALAIAFLTLTACSGPTTEVSAKSEPEKAVAPAVPVTAKTAFWEIYKAAHAWAPDMLPLTMEAKSIDGVKNEDGKAGMWEATFGSPSKREWSKFSYAVAAAGDIRKGVTASQALPWAGPTHDALAFQSSEFQVDSDAAYATAHEKAAAWLKEHPGTPLNTFSLGAASRVPGPVWSFVWGDKKLGFLELVSASSGKVLK